jgi:DHA2 family multidrug resistance protein-like MFS transporter
MMSLPETPRATHAFDRVGAALTAGCLGLLIGGLSFAVQTRAFVASAIGMSLGVLFGALVMRRHADHPAPMLPVDLFRNAAFALSVVTAVLTFVAQGLAFVALPFLFLHSLGLSLIEAGLLLMPWPLAVAMLAPIVGPLTDRLSAAILGGTGLLTMAAGLGLVAMLPQHPAIIDIVWRLMVCGFGFGLFQTPNMRMLISNSPRHRSGSAGGVAATSRLSGQAIGAASAALCFGFSETSGPTIALVAAAFIALAGAAASFLRLSIRR